MTTPARNVIIVGAGLAGALMAVYLARRGCRVQVYERRPDPRVAGFVGGRSINLALSTRGIDALQRVGLAERVLADAIPMPGRMIHARDGRLSFQRYSRHEHEAINSVGRGALNITLLDAADSMDGVDLHFNCRCVDVDLQRPAVTFAREPGGEVFIAAADVVIGADGAFSAVRGAMQRTERFDYSQSYLEHGYKELSIPPTAAGEFAWEPHALHIWPRGGAMMIALPNLDRTFTVTCFWPFSGPMGFDAVRGPDEIVPFFERHYPDAVPLMPDLAEQYQQNPTSALVTIRCRPWHEGGRVLLIGDAAHAIIPFYGQGMNAAFEDCALLDEQLERHGLDWPAAFAAFSTNRKPDADAIADMALDNFIEMRDRVKSPVFRMRKRFQHLLHGLFPRACIPLYNMVSFSRIPYAEARRRARRQAWVVRGVVAAVVVIVAVALLVVAAG